MKGHVHRMMQSTVYMTASRCWSGRGNRRILFSIAHVAPKVGSHQDRDGPSLLCCEGTPSSSICTKVWFRTSNIFRGSDIGTFLIGGQD